MFEEEIYAEMEAMGVLELKTLNSYAMYETEKEILLSVNVAGATVENGDYGVYLQILEYGDDVRGVAGIVNKMLVWVNMTRKSARSLCREVCATNTVFNCIDNPDATMQDEENGYVRYLLKRVNVPEVSMRRYGV